jgi:hypothetical protein
MHAGFKMKLTDESKRNPIKFGWFPAGEGV